MIETGDWIQPHIGGEPYLKKPPLLNWMVALSFLATGAESETAARLVSVLCMLLFALQLLWTPNPLWTIRGRAFGGLFFLTSASLLDKGRLIEMEASYVALTGAAVTQWVAAWARGRRDLGLWLLPALFLALGMLEKGPLHFVFFYGVVLTVLRRDRALRRLISPAHLSSLAVAVGLFVVWTKLARDANPAVREVMAGTWSEQMGSRLDPSRIHLGRWMTSTLRGVLGFAPWILFVPWLLRSVRADEGFHGRRLLVSVALGTALGFGIVALMPGLATRYLLPAYGASAMVTGGAFARFRTPRRVEAVWRHGLSGGLVLLGLAAIVGVLGWARSLGGLCLAVFATALGVFAVALRGRPRTDATLVVATALLAALIWCGFATFEPVVRDGHDRLRAVQRAVEETVPPGETVHVLRPRRNAFLYYVRRPRAYVVKEDRLSDATIRYLIAKDADLANLDALAARRPVRLLELNAAIAPDRRKIKGDWWLVALDGVALPPRDHR
jgi:4-amino-4-deoxy-L-arabinose transferase-like glycosyltransferase